MRSLVSTLLAALAFVAGASLVAGKAHAQTTSVVVLGLTSMEGDDTFATNLSGALRQAATQVRGWSVSDRDVPLSQLELATGCDATELTCVQQIANAVGAQRLVYGTIQRAGSGARFEFVIRIHLYDSATNSILRSLEERLPSSRTDIDDVRDPARSYATALAEVAGATQAGGTGLPPEGVGIDGGQTGGGETGGGETGGGETGGGDTGGQTSSGGGDDLGRLNWAAFALLAVGVGGAVGWIVTGLDAQTNQSTVATFRGTQGPTGGLSICDGTIVGANGNVRAACDSPSEILQFVFMGVTAIAGGAGLALLAINGVMSPESGGPTDRVRLRLTPSFSPQGGYLGAQLSF